MSAGYSRIVALRPRQRCLAGPTVLVTLRLIALRPRYRSVAFLRGDRPDVAAPLAVWVLWARCSETTRLVLVGELRAMTFDLMTRGGARPQAFVVSAGTFYVPAWPAGAAAAADASNSWPTRFAGVAPAPRRRRLIHQWHSASGSGANPGNRPQRGRPMSAQGGAKRNPG